MKPMDEDIRTIVDLDRLIHEPSRMMVMTILNTVESADFLYLLRETRLTKGNLSSHLTRLEEAGYIEIEKTYRGKVPQTICRQTEKGREAFQRYREHLRRALDHTGG